MTIKIKDMEVKIDFFFILLVLFCLSAGLWNDVFAAIAALGFHELGHIAAAEALGLKVEKIDILPLGGRIKILNLDEASPEAEMLTVLAGPMMNFAVSIFLLLLFNQSEIVSKLGKNFIDYQLMIGFFNMLPALPLDGGRVFVLWLRQHMNYISAVRVAAGLSKAFALAMFLVSVVGLFVGRLFINFAIAGFFLLSYAFKEQKDAPIFFIKNIARKKEMLFKKGFLPMETLAAVGNTPVKRLLYEFMPNKYYIVYMLDSSMKIKNCLTETEIFDKIIREGLDRKLEDLI
ncbi:MAG: M50 family metallopeptidase [Tepidanaerobacteraceae bacterium]|jgi:stage IV sporulation protein FB|nr:M50 family metallopeptidase [Tepidanaerobacteraceae bacterium]